MLRSMGELKEFLFQRLRLSLADNERKMVSAVVLRRRRQAL